MPYTFSLENRAIAALVITLTAVMVLVFLGGLLIGFRTVPASGDQQLPASVPPAGAQPALLSSSQAAANTVSQDSATAAPCSCSCNRVVAKREDSPPETKTETVDAGGEELAEWLPEDDDPELPAQEIVVAEQAEPPPAAWAPAGDGLYTLQVGAFSVKENVDRLVDNLRDLGYQPHVFEVTDFRDRVLRAVRLGSYQGRQEAARAASELSRQENLLAIVRPLGAL